MVEIYHSYDEFESEKIECRSCCVGLEYNKVVLSDGMVGVSLVIVGEAPGKDELEQGKPFVGKCGKFLRKTLKEFGIDETNSLITNTIPCRPPNNVFPKDKELVKKCVAKWLHREINIVEPKFVLLLGANAARFVFDFDFKKFSDIRGKIEDVNFNGRWIKVIPTFHPSYVMRKMYSKTEDIVGAFRKDVGMVANAVRKI
jgi:DNA polymerase